MQAVILAGGKGTRLRPYTAVFPKPLVPVGDQPIMEIVIKQLKKAGFNSIVISTGHLADLIQVYFGNGEKLGVEITYAREEKPLGTAGSLALIKNLDENFLVMNGDLLTTLDYRKMFDFHKQKKACATVGVFEREYRIEYGVISASKEGLMDDYVEKPTANYLVSMGINILNKNALGYIKKNEVLGMPELMLRLKGGKERVFCFSDECEWLDIGRPDDYELAQKNFGEHPERYLHD